VITRQEITGITYDGHDRVNFKSVATYDASGDLMYSQDITITAYSGDNVSAQTVKTYDARGNIVSTEIYQDMLYDAENNLVYYTYKAYNDMGEFVQGSRVSAAYDPMGNLTYQEIETFTDEALSVSAGMAIKDNFTYDAMGNALSYDYREYNPDGTFKSGQTITMEYGSNGRVSKQIITMYTDEELTVYDGEEIKDNIEYDGRGNITSYDYKIYDASGIFESGARVKSRYDTKGNLVWQSMEGFKDEELTISTGKEVKNNFVYDSDGNALSYELKEYDERGDFVGGSRIEFTYDSKGRITEQRIETFSDEEFINFEGREIRKNFAYDSKGNVISYESRVYNANGSFKEGSVVTLKYDSMGRVVYQQVDSYKNSALTYFAGREIKFGMRYNADGDVISYSLLSYGADKKLKSAQKISLKYDSRGRIRKQTIEEFKDENFVKAIGKEVRDSFAYDARGNVTSYDSRTYGRTGIFESGEKVYIEYNSANRVKKHTVEYFDDEALTSFTGKEVSSDFEYDLLGNLLSYELRIYDSDNEFVSGTRYAYKYDGEGRLQEQTQEQFSDEDFTVSEGKEVTGGFEYDRHGNVSSYYIKTYDDKGKFVLGVKVDTSYDKMGRVKSQTIENFADEDLTISEGKETRGGFEYDDRGNLLSYYVKNYNASGIVTSSQRVAYTYDEEDRLTEIRVETFEDEAMLKSIRLEITNNFVYDQRGNALSFTKTTYDADGKAIRRIETTTEYDQNDRIVEQTVKSYASSSSIWGDEMVLVGITMRRDIKYDSKGRIVSQTVITLGDGVTPLASYYEPPQTGYMDGGDEYLGTGGFDLDYTNEAHWQHFGSWIVDKETYTYHGDGSITKHISKTGHNDIYGDIAEGQHETTYKIPAAAVDEDGNIIYDTYTGEPIEFVKTERITAGGNDFTRITTRTNAKTLTINGQIYLISYDETISVNGSVYNPQTRNHDPVDSMHAYTHRREFDSLGNCTYDNSTDTFKDPDGVTVTHTTTITREYEAGKLIKQTTDGTAPGPRNYIDSDLWALYWSDTDTGRALRANFNATGAGIEGTYWEGSTLVDWALTNWEAHGLTQYGPRGDTLTTTSVKTDFSTGGWVWVAGGGGYMGMGQMEWDPSLQNYTETSSSYHIDANGNKVIDSTSTTYVRNEKLNSLGAPISRRTRSSGVDVTGKSTSSSIWMDEAFTYNVLGWLVFKRTWGDVEDSEGTQGSNTDYTYDAQGNVIQTHVEQWQNNGCGSNVYKDNKTYDANGGLVSHSTYKYDVEGSFWNSTIGTVVKIVIKVIIAVLAIIAFIVPVTAPLVAILIAALSFALVVAACSAILDMYIQYVTYGQIDWGSVALGFAISFVVSFIAFYASVVGAAADAAASAAAEAAALDAAILGTSIGEIATKESLVSFFMNAMNGIWQAIQNIFKTIATWIIDTFAGVVNYMTQIVLQNFIVSQLQSMVFQIVAAVFSDPLYDFGRSLGLSDDWATILSVVLVTAISTILTGSWTDPLAKAPPSIGSAWWVKAFQALSLDFAGFASIGGIVSSALNIAKDFVWGKIQQWLGVVVWDDNKGKWVSNPDRDGWAWQTWFTSIMPQLGDWASKVEQAIRIRDAVRILAAKGINFGDLDKIQAEKMWNYLQQIGQGLLSVDVDESSGQITFMLYEDIEKLKDGIERKAHYDLDKELGIMCMMAHTNIRSIIWII